MCLMYLILLRSSYYHESVLPKYGATNLLWIKLIVLVVHSLYYNPTNMEHSIHNVAIHLVCGGEAVWTYCQMIKNNIEGSLW
jgi:fumarate reductase subunit D